MGRRARFFQAVIHSAKVEATETTEAAPAQEGPKAQESPRAGQTGRSAKDELLCDMWGQGSLSPLPRRPAYPKFSGGAIRLRQESLDRLDRPRRLVAAWLPSIPFTCGNLASNKRPRKG